MSTSNFDWNHAKAFLAVAQTGTLTAAAAQLKLTQPTLGRQITALEEELGTVLFDRVGKRLILTDAGKVIAEQLMPMTEAARHASLFAASQSDTVEGVVTITASDIYAAHLLPKLLAKLKGKSQNLHIKINAINHVEDIRRREADIAIRHVRPQEPELFARLIGEHIANFYATQSYLDHYGQPQTLEDLRYHQFVGFGDEEQVISYLQERGIPITAENCRFKTESGLVGLELASQGLGIIVMADIVALNRPELVRLPLPIDPIRFPTWLVSHRELQTSKKIRLVFDFLSEALKG
ncbi:LysR family transcriptional regulator [Polycladidibacter stylochi]|uniref:LysR family transcriptional regulator n=1 Tax=Polycladidibacter stylochi TaxID=1807766 RepID=UPI0009E8BDEC|nr:LysR family transcriptional regulator [Pseudovibrio stylochi]